MRSMISKKPSTEKQCIKLLSLFLFFLLGTLARCLRGLEIVWHCITQAIKRKSPNTVSCDAFQISIHSFKEPLSLSVSLFRSQTVDYPVVKLSAWLCRTAGGRRRRRCPKAFVALMSRQLMICFGCLLAQALFT